MTKSNQTPQYLTQAIKVIDCWLDCQRIINRIPGIAVAIVWKDKPVFLKGYGYEDLSTKKPVTANSVFRIALLAGYAGADLLESLVKI